MAVCSQAFPRFLGKAANLIEGERFSPILYVHTQL